MEKKGLLIGIDFAEDFLRVCYFNERHAQVENVLAPGARLGILIPAVLCFDGGSGAWLIGEEAENFSAETGAYLYTELLTGALGGRTYDMNGESMPYASLLSILFEKIIDMVRTSSGIFPVFHVNIAMRKVNLEIKGLMEAALCGAGLEKERLHFLNYPESFAYFILQQDEQLWRDEALLFDFSKDGFFMNRLTASSSGRKNKIFVNERNYSMEFSVKDLENAVLRPRLDEKLGELYEEERGEGENASVYFTGEGFAELWFSQTLKTISLKRRAFRGNNIYAKGACLEGLFRKEGTLEDIMVICRPKTKASICVEARYRGQAKNVVLSEAAVNWYEASRTADFFLDESRKIVFKTVSLLGAEETDIVFDLSAFPDRPPKTTRVRASIHYINEYECEISVKDLGFGSFYPSQGGEVRKILNLEGYI